MKFIKSVLVLLFLSGSLPLLAQPLSVSFQSLAGTKDQLPFWLWANQLGRFDRTSQSIQDFRVTGQYDHVFGASGFGFQTKADLDILLADNNSIRFTEWFGGLSWKFLQLNFGAFADQELYDGLSSTNGNLASSRNARPHPAVRAGFNRFVNLLPWFAIHGFYEEGMLNDERYVTDTHLHRKALYVRLGTPESVQITGGLEHFVMWYGTHPVYGRLQGWEAYFNYVTGQRGDSDALATDQGNVTGNSYGVYQLTFKKDWKKVETTLYLSHPFDDHSGMELENLPDNLYGLYLHIKKENSFLQSLVFEYFYTKNQSGSIHLVPNPDGSYSGHGLDDYFNHSIYRSGVTYERMSMASPIFAPVIVEDGISMGFENTRFAGFHAGANGHWSESLGWKSMLTFSDNFGKYSSEGGDTYSPSRKMASALVELNWNPPGKPVYFGVSLAADHGSLYDAGTSVTRLGAMLSVRWELLR